MSQIVPSNDASGQPPADGPPESMRAEWVRLHAPVVMAVCLANTRRLPDAEDVMQETFVRAFAHGDSLRDPAKARPWLMQIARRLCVDQARRQKPAAPLPDALPARTTARNPRVERLHAALARLPEAYRETISLYYLDGQSCEGVAATLGVSSGAVRTRLCRARVMLFDLLTEEEK